MRIIHVNNNVGVGGAQRVMIDLGAHQHGHGHQVITVASPHGDWWPRVAGTATPLPQLAGEHGSVVRILRSALALRRLIDTTFPDVVHVHQRPLATALRLAMIGRRRVPVVEHAHSLATGLGWVSYRWSDLVIAPGRDVARHVRHTYRHATGKVVCIPNSVADPGPSHTVAGRTGPLRLVAVGRVVADKDPSWFVDLVAALRDQGLDVTGRWLGDGPDREHLARQTIERGVPVDFPGRTPIVQLELVAADLIVSSSVLEAMPISLLEALAAGRAIVARDVGAIGELVDHDNGLLVNPGLSAPKVAEQLIERLGTEPRGRLAAWGVQSRQRYEREHDPAAVGAAVLGVYETAIARHRRDRTRVTAGQLALAPVAWVLLHLCHLMLRVIGLERSLAVVGARGAWTDADAHDGPASFAELSPMRRRMAWALQRAGVGWRRSHGPCLRRALATSLVLRKHGPVVHFGVKRGDETPLAHAWVTVGSLRFDPDRSYEPFTWNRVA